ncbi:MAG: F0F1 ATP synthase subunit A [Oscillospiraceae bacterium]
MEETSNVLFSIIGIEVTKPVVTSWVIMLVLILLSILVTRNLKDVPKPFQSMVEMAIEKLEKFFADILGYKYMRKYFHIFATLFIFIVISNYSGLLPGAGKLFAVPTASLSVAAGLAVVAFMTTHAIGLSCQGPGKYLKSFLKPFVLMLPLALIEQAVRPFSLALRLYGNLYGEEQVTEQLAEMFPIILPLVMQVLSLMFCLIQAMVFTMLLAIFVHEAIGEEE